MTWKENHPVVAVQKKKPGSSTPAPVLDQMSGNSPMQPHAGSPVRDMTAVRALPVLAGELKNSSAWEGLPVDRYVLITDLGITKIPGPAYDGSDVQIVVNAVKKA